MEIVKLEISCEVGSVAQKPYVVNYYFVCVVNTQQWYQNDTRCTPHRETLQGTCYFERELLYVYE
jgi:hypothetical protein